nr:hypothetical protein [Microbacterium hydrocarbonoxydans]
MRGETSWRDVTVAWSSPAELRGFTYDDLAAMGQSQLDRFRRLSGSRAEDFVAGRALIRLLVRRISGSDDVVVSSRCDNCGEDHGRPRCEGVSLSVSHATGLVVVAATSTSVQLGVDVEATTAAGRTDELRSMFPVGSAPDLAAWTRMEAAVKADGRGFEIDPSDVLLQPRRGADPCTWTATLPGRRTAVEVTTLVGPPGYVLSVARA